MKVEFSGRLLHSNVPLTVEGKGELDYSGVPSPQLTTGFRTILVPSLLVFERDIFSTQRLQLTLQHTLFVFAE